MKTKTKTGILIFLIGFFIFVIGLVLMWFEIIPVTENFDLWFIMIFVFVIAFILMFMGGRMVKLRMLRWMEND